MEWIVLLVGGAFASAPLGAALLLDARALYVILSTVVALAGLAAVSFYVWLYLELGGEDSVALQVVSALLAATQVVVAAVVAVRRRAARVDELSTNAQLPGAAAARTN